MILDMSGFYNLANAYVDLSRDMERLNYQLTSIAVDYKISLVFGYPEGAD